MLLFSGQPDADTLIIELPEKISSEFETFVRTLSGIDEFNVNLNIPESKLENFAQFSAVVIALS